jgi:hypothetical protein
MSRSSRSRLSLSIVLALVTLVSLLPMLVWDAAPGLFPAGAHRVLAAVPLTLIAVAYLVHQGMRGAGMDFAKAVLSALAFVLWALNQLLPDHPWATLFNDLAVAAFVLDVVLVIVGWPPAGQPEAVHAERRTLEAAAVGVEKAR